MTIARHSLFGVTLLFGASSGCSAAPDNVLIGGGTDPTSALPGLPADGGTRVKAPDGGAAGAGIPCDVAALFATKCVSCHSDPPVGGSLSGLVTVADLLATAKEDATKNEAQLSLARMKNAASPMPPRSVGNPATPAEIAAVEGWIRGNYAGSCAGMGAPPPPPTSVFTGAGAFVGRTTSSTHNAGQNCMGSCHDHSFTFAGTLTDGAGNGVAGAEVRLVDGSGTAITVHTGPEGNFHSTIPFAGAAHVGARTASNTVDMVSTITNGGCNGCHATGGTTTPIHVP